MLFRSPGAKNQLYFVNIWIKKGPEPVVFGNFPWKRDAIPRGFCEKVGGTSLQLKFDLL